MVLPWSVFWPTRKGEQVPGILARAGGFLRRQGAPKQTPHAVTHEIDTQSSAARMPPLGAARGSQCAGSGCRARCGRPQRGSKKPFHYGGRMSTDVMIEASGLSKRFGRVRALDKISFKVKKGEVVGFLGPNGAGKSTTMRI